MREASAASINVYVDDEHDEPVPNDQTGPPDRQDSPRLQGGFGRPQGCLVRRRIVRWLHRDPWGAVRRSTDI